MNAIRLAAQAALIFLLVPASAPLLAQVTEYPVSPGDRPHDVAPAPDGGVWFTVQVKGLLGHLDPSTGKLTYVVLGSGSRPHGVIVGPDGSAWITDGGLNAVLRVNAPGGPVSRFTLPNEGADLNTAAFDGAGTLWFTGQAGVHGSLDPKTGSLRVLPSPRGRGPYGIASLPDGRVCFVSLAGDYAGLVDSATGAVTVIPAPSPRQGTRRIWADSKGILWITGWGSGNLLRLDPRTRRWEIHRLPGDHPRPYAVYVDEHDLVWVSDWGSNAMLRFDPRTGSFTQYPLPTPDAEVRQILGRHGEVWGAESGTDRLFVIRFGE